MEERIREVASDLSNLATEAKEQFGSLSVQQLNWKPDEKSWSVGQCLDHLITTHSLYFPLFERLEQGSFRQSFWERHSPWSGYFGRFLIRSLRPENKKKMKTTARAQPSASQIDERVVERYCKHQAELINHLRRIPTGIDPAKIVIASPLLAFVTYSLDDCLTILVVHVQRHLGQASRVTKTVGFPG